jgi:hypothetical protein
VNILVFLLLCINILLKPEKSDCVPLTFKFSPSMIKVAEFLKRLTLNRRPLVASRRYSGFVKIVYRDMFFVGYVSVCRIQASVLFVVRNVIALLESHEC